MRKQRIISFLVIVIFIAYFVWLFLYNSVPKRDFLAVLTQKVSREPTGLDGTAVKQKSDTSLKEGIYNGLTHFNKYGNSKTCSLLDSRLDNISVDRLPYFKQEFVIVRAPMRSWIAPETTVVLCDEKIKLFDGRFGLLKDIIVDSSKRLDVSDHVKGGEAFKIAVGREVRYGNFKYQRGFWKICCKSGNITKDVPKSFNWSPFIEIKTNETAFQKKYADIDVVSKFTIAITREDYWNLHNFVRHMYNIFLIMTFLNKKPSEISILFLDAHPSYIFDVTWEYIFGPVSRAGRFTGPVLYRNLVWGFRESDGGLTDFELKQQAYLEEFRSYFLTLHGLSDFKSLNCRDITITIILRRDHINYPMNTNGHSQRKIFNEAEIVGNLMKAFPFARVQSVLMETLPLCKQLELASTTDILIGMHGAGMTHSIFLPKHAAILEMFPKDWKTRRPWYLCYEKVASWRGLKYDHWENVYGSLEMPHDYTVVPGNAIINKTSILINKMCS